MRSLKLSPTHLGLVCDTTGYNPHWKEKSIKVERHLKGKTGHIFISWRWISTYI